MRVSDAVIDRLVANDIADVFGIPGKQTLPLNDAIERSEAIRFIMARHETAVSHAAWGYAETSGEMAATLVVPGPGDMNAMNGLKNALNDCTPLLHLSVETDRELRGGDAIHETPPETYDTVVKENILVETAASAPIEIDRAIAIARTPPTGPVRVGIPKSFLDEPLVSVESGDFDIEAIDAPPAGAIETAASMLGAARMPIIIAGGGVRAAGASEELIQTAELLDAPVVTTYKGKGVIHEDHELSAGVLTTAAHQSLAECLDASDVGLAVGTDFDAVATGRWSAPMPDQLIHVTLEPDDVGTGYSPAVGIVADAADSLAALLDRMAPTTAPAERIDGAKRASGVRDAHERRFDALVRETDSVLSIVEALRAVRHGLPRDTIVSVDAGGFRLWGLLAFESYGPRRYVNPGSWATMGTGLPAGVGATCANESSPVAVLTGDGGVMMCIHELHTAVAENIPVTVIVFRNDDYAIISEDAIENYENQPAGYDWPEAPISFVTVAEGMGCRAERVDAESAIPDAVANAVDADVPALIEIPVDPEGPQAKSWLSETPDST